MQIILGAKDPELVEAWTSEFAAVPDVRVRGGNIVMVKADAIVSPANSFGFMDGGFDWTLSDLFEWKIQAVVQKAIREKHGGELLVGAAEVVPTDHEQFPYLVCAPTMRVPQDVSESVNAFLAMRAILLAVRAFNAAKGNAIQTLAIPGLCTGIGRMPAERCARQMKAAYDLVYGNSGNHYRSLSEAIADEKKYKGID